MVGIEQFGNEDAWMAYLPWSTAYCIGVQSIDDEHRELVDLVNELHQGLLASAPEEEIKKILRRLSVCTSTHFWHEEKHFEGTDYPRAAIHVRKHGHLLVILSCFENGVDRVGKRISFEDQLGFLRDWLMDHIANEDKPLGDYLNAQEHAKSASIATL